jgi:hypothetical protein
MNGLVILDRSPRLAVSSEAKDFEFLPAPGAAISVCRMWVDLNLYSPPVLSAADIIRVARLLCFDNPESELCLKSGNKTANFTVWKLLYSPVLIDP